MKGTAGSPVTPEEGEMDFIPWHESRGMNGRLVPLDSRRDAFNPRGCEFRVTASSCRRPCVCDGFEVCLHLFHRHGRGPIWPVFSARTKEEARAIQGKVLRFASTLDPKADQELITKALEAWALATGWSKTHHVVWSRIRSEVKEGSMVSE